MLCLGIETSCDETAAAVVSSDRHVLSSQVLSQLDDHRPYGGVVPEIAARAHLEHVDRLISASLQAAAVSLQDVDVIAATAGPGLIGGVMVGMMTGKALALAMGKPFVAVNHLEGHALTVRLTDDVPFPYLLLLASGGHCQLLVVRGVGQYQRLGTTLDDAVGEAFDKVAKMVGLGYPGGPQVEHWAARGRADRFALPRPLKGKPHCDFSFSGLKNAVRLTVESLPSPLSEQDQADVCASFQAAVAEAVADRLRRALGWFRRDNPEGQHVVVAGGVAANQVLRHALRHESSRAGLTFVAPPLSLCTDNAAMIAWAGLERFRLGQSNGLDVAARPRWPLG